MITPSRRCISGRARAASGVFLALGLFHLTACGGEKAGADAYAEIIAEVVPTIEETIGLKFKTPPKIESRSKEQVREFVKSQVTDSLAKEQLAGVEAAYKAFGLVPDTLNLQQFLVDLLEEQIEGYYDPKTKVLYVVDRVPNDALKMTIAHELIHALQDQYVSLDSLRYLSNNSDRQVAAQSVFEGQAVYEQLSGMSGKKNLATALPGGWERVRQLIRDNRAAMPIYSAAPLIIQETLLFPYLSGAEFIRMYKENKKEGAPFQDLPVSTEQIMHPRSYFETRDDPTSITFAPIAGLIPVFSNTLGEFETRVFLYYYIEAQDDAVRGATGWDGDRYVVFNTTGGQGIAWASVWDSKTDAAEFYSFAQAAAQARKNRQSNRQVQVSTGEVNGRPVVLYVDVPVGANPQVVTIDAIRLGASEASPAVGATSR